MPKLSRFKEIASEDLTQDFISIAEKFIKDLNISEKGTKVVSIKEGVELRLPSHADFLSFQSLIKAFKSYPFSQGLTGSLGSRDSILLVAGSSSKYHGNVDTKKAAQELTSKFN